MPQAQQALTPEQFAVRIRQKYPGAYDDIPDAELTSRILAKYPQYGDMVSTAPPPKQEPYQPAEQGATGFEYYQAPPIGQMLVGAMKSAPSTGAMTGVETGYERPGQPVMDVNQTVRQATQPQNMGEYAGQVIGNVGQALPAVSGAFELASKVPGLVRPLASKILGKAMPSVAELTGTTPARLAELQAFPGKIEDIRQSVITAEKNAHKAASAQFPQFDKPIELSRTTEQVPSGLLDASGKPMVRTVEKVESASWKELQEQRSNLLKDIANERRAVSRGAAPRFDLSDMYDKLSKLDDVMNTAAVAQGGAKGLAQLQQARQTFGKYMQDFHNPGSPLRGILEAKPGEATKVMQQFFNQNVGPRALETLRSYGVDTAPIEGMISQGTRPLRVTAAESAKLREAGSPEAYITRRLNESLRQSMVNELPSSAEARLPADVMRSRWPSITGKVPGVNIFNPRRITQWRLERELARLPAAAPAELQGTPTPFSLPPVSGGSEPQWPTAYQNAPRALTSAGGGGANYTAADLEAFKAKHGIQATTPAGEDFIEQLRRGGSEPPAEAYPINQVPREQRASTQITKAANQQLGERISGRSATKQDIEASPLDKLLKKSKLKRDPKTGRLIKE